MITKTILTLDPTDLRHRRLIAAAIKAKDAAALAQLKGNTQKPIWFINSWFLYSLMASSWEKETERSHVPIYSPQAQLDFARFARRRQGEEDNASPVIDELGIPLDTYAFLA
ncbi:hypothetical protein [Spirosoma jeollabukense]